MSPLRTLLLAACCAAFAARAERNLMDEVVAVVDAQSVTLSDLEAETRIRLALEQGPAAAQVPLGRGLLAASLRRTVEERVVLAEAERLKSFEAERLEVENQLARLKGRFGTDAHWEAFLRRLELTEDEIASVLARQLRVARYLDSRLRLPAQLRESELDEAAQGRELTAAERGALRDRLAGEKYQRLLRELLADLRRRTVVRVLDPLDPAQPGSGGDAPGPGKVR